MGAERQEHEGDTHNLRALLVRFLIEASPSDPRLAQVISAMEQVVKVARAGTGEGWQQDLASVKTDLGRVRQLVEGVSQPALVPQIQALLDQGDTELIALLEASEQRAQAQLAQMSALLGQLTDRVGKLEAQIQKLAHNRP